MRWILIIGVLLFGPAGLAQTSPFNGLEVPPAGSMGRYRILIGGHFHGASNNSSGFPAATLLANLDTINALGAELFLSTGDLFMDPMKDMPRYQRSLFSRLKMPFFNAPGNHDQYAADARDPVEFDLPFDPGRQSDTIFHDRVLVLNTELNGGSLIDDQLGRLDNLAGAIGMRNLFIISHRPIWAEDDPQYSDLFRANTRSLTGTNFRKDVYPLLERIARHSHVYWISGSMGGMAPASIFLQEHAPNITYIQCAIRDLPRDALLIADVHPDTVKWSALSLTGQKLMAPEAYDAAWWRKNIGKPQPFNWRLLPYLVKTTVLNRAFWWGMGSALVLVFAVMGVRRCARR